MPFLKSRLEPRSRCSVPDRRIQMLRTAMGPVIAAALEDPDVVEIMLNPDRTLWWIACPLAVRRSASNCPRPMANASSASSPPMSAEVHRGQPLLTAELPETGERFEGICRPPHPARPLRCGSVP